MAELTRRRLLEGSALAVATVGLGGFRRALAQPMQSGDADTEWHHYAGDQANTRYAPLDQIDGENFGDLELAWSFKTDVLGARKEYQFEATPLLIKGRLFLTAGSRRDCISVDAATGELLW